MQFKLKSLLPFLRWFPMSGNQLRADLVAGITVALVLVPQSMAYAQLAGLPVVYGLYASFVPVIIASLWGSSNQLHTGPVAMLSLMSAAALIPFATPGRPDFIELSIMLALMVGVLRLSLGVFRLGAIVNLLSNPVIVGFTNAAAIIIGLSQLSKILGVPFVRTDSYLVDLWRVIHQFTELHWPTLLFAAGAWLLMALIKRISPVLPGILIAVVVATVLSAMLGFEEKITLDAGQVRDPGVAQAITRYHAQHTESGVLTQTIADNNQRMENLKQSGTGSTVQQIAQLNAANMVLQAELSELTQTIARLRTDLHAMELEGVEHDDGRLHIYEAGALPAGVEGDGKVWRYSGMDGDRLVFSAGGAVVGDIPRGLPGVAVPSLQWDLILALLPAALVMALIGFMEATSISKAIAASTGERLNANKELVGQGLANIVGSFFSSYTVSGSFSRSAVAAKAGARTGLFAVISALAVVLVLLFFTGYLYHLPQAVLAVIVMMAVFGLIRIKPLLHAWRIDRTGAMIGHVTFAATLLMAPAIANGILLGVGLTIFVCLISTMRPRTEIIGRKLDGTLGGIRAHGLKPLSEHFVPVRFDGSLTFINVAYFEDMILEAHTRFPKAKVILVVGSGINDIDASGEDKIRDVAGRLREAGVRLMFSGLKHQVMQVLRRSGLVDELGEEAFFKSKLDALTLLGREFDEQNEQTLGETPPKDEQQSGRLGQTVQSGQ